MFKQLTAAALDAVPPSIASRFSRDNRLVRLARPLINRTLGDGYLQVTVRSGLGEGLRLLIDTSCEKYYWTGTHEPEVQEALQRTLKPGDVVWDVGGHIGFFALMAARLTETGEVHVFEPIEENRERLAANVVANQLTNVRTQPFALAAEDGEATLLNRDSSLMWSLVKGTSENGRKVQCKTLDSMSDLLPLPDLIKVDAEEAEVDVLRGGSKLLRDHAPALIVEFTNQELVNEAKTLLPQYRFEQIGRRHWFLRKASLD